MLGCVVPLVLCKHTHTHKHVCCASAPLCFNNITWIKSDSKATDTSSDPCTDRKLAKSCRKKCFNNTVPLYHLEVSFKADNPTLYWNQNARKEEHSREHGRELTTFSPPEAVNYFSNVGHRKQRFREWERKQKEETRYELQVWHCEFTTHRHLHLRWGSNGISTCWLV